MQNIEALAAKFEASQRRSERVVIALSAAVICGMGAFIVSQSGVVEKRLLSEDEITGKLASGKYYLHCKESERTDPEKVFPRWPTRPENQRSYVARVKNGTCTFHFGLAPRYPGGLDFMTPDP